MEKFKFKNKPELKIKIRLYKEVGLLGALSPACLRIVQLEEVP